MFSDIHLLNAYKSYQSVCYKKIMLLEFQLMKSLQEIIFIVCFTSKIISSVVQWYIEFDSFIR